MQTLFMLVCTVAAWLHLTCGLSPQCLKFINIIVFTAVELGRLLAQLPYLSSSPSFAIPPLLLPTDVRKAMSALSVEPNIIRSICCPKCLAKYNLDSLPQVCLCRETPRSKVCGEKLWTTRSTRGGPCTVPRCWCAGSPVSMGIHTRWLKGSQWKAEMLWGCERWYAPSSATHRNRLFDFSTKSQVPQDYRRAKAYDIVRLRPTRALID